MVAAQLAESAQQQHLTLQAMQQAMLDQMALQMAPMLDMVNAATRRAETDKLDLESSDREAARGQEVIAHLERLRLADEQKHEQALLAEQARVNTVLPPRTLQPDAEARLRGGKARMPGRMDDFRRLMENTGDLSEDQILQLEGVLGRGHQVTPSPVSVPLSLWGVEASQAPRSAPALFQRLQQQGIAPMSDSEKAVRSVLSVFKLAGEKETKKESEVKTYDDFYDLILKSKCLTRDAHDKDPTSYWQMDWHFKSVHHLNSMYGWKVAGDYHTRVMTEWQDGDLVVDAMVDTEENRRGNIEGALHQRAFLVAMQLQRGSAAKARAVGGAQGSGSGAATRQQSTDTLCSFCNWWFPAGKKHQTSNCNKKKAAEAAKP